MLPRTAPLASHGRVVVTSTRRHGPRAVRAKKDAKNADVGAEPLQIPVVSTEAEQLAIEEEGWKKTDKAEQPAPADTKSSSGAVEVPPTSELYSSTDERFKDVGKVFVAGATGKTGRAVVKALVAKGIKVVALVRDRSKVKDLPGPYAGVDVVKGDVYQYATLASAMQDCDAVICATGANNIADPLGPFSVDYSGTLNLIAASKRAGVKKFVYVTSIGTDDPLINPLNLFWGILFWKKRAEEELQRSGLDHTIVRPGGLVGDESDSTRGRGNIVMAPAGTYGIPPRTAAGSVPRSKVAECCVEALVQPKALNNIVEIVADSSAPALTWEDLFTSAAI